MSDDFQEKDNASNLDVAPATKPTYPCESCSYVGNCPSQLLSHQFHLHMSPKEKRKVADYKCDICIFSTFHVEDLTSHLRTNHNKPILNLEQEEEGTLSSCQPKQEVPWRSCRDCTYFKTKSLEDLLMHVEKVHKKYIADVSLKKLQNKLNLSFSDSKCRRRKTGVLKGKQIKKKTGSLIEKSSEKAGSLDGKLSKKTGSLKGKHDTKTTGSLIEKSGNNNPKCS